MSDRVNRRTVDLSGYPDLVVIYLGLRVNAFTGLRTLAGFGPRIAQSVEARPDGLLRFAPVHAAKGSRFTARGRAKRHGEPKAPVVVSEHDFYS